MKGGLSPWTLKLPSDEPFPDQSNLLSAGWLVQRNCEPEEAIRTELEARGFKFAEANRSIEIRAVLTAAEELIGRVPSLERAVARTVGRVYVLQAEDSYDVSHSEPRWSTSIFASVPRRSDKVASLRAAESVVHEAMHLQLTNLENHQGLTADNKSLMSSPWRDEPRLRQGVLHGLYVFRCIESFFRELSTCANLTKVGQLHVAQRLHTIRAELSSVAIEELLAGLTPSGRRLVYELVGGT